MRALGLAMLITPLLGLLGVFVWGAAQEAGWKVAVKYWAVYFLFCGWVAVGAYLYASG